jgi:hypothetical protein
VLRLGNIKNGEKFWALSKIRETVRKLYFQKKVYFWQIIPAFLPSITLTAQVKEFLSSLGKTANIYLEAEYPFFLDGIFKNCPKQFAQLYSLHLAIGNISHKKYIYLVTFALLPYKKIK